jgi:hypothetical protein
MFALPIGLVSAKTLEFHRQCGEYKYIITVDNPEHFYGNVIRHYFQKKAEKRILFYQTEEDMLVDASCINGKNNSVLFIFQEQCSGNACPENIYGLFDPKKNIILLNPNNWPKGNDEEVIKIVGFEPALFHDENDSFCCNGQLGEYNNYGNDI